MEKKLDGNYTRVMQGIVSKSCRQHPTTQQLYSHLPLFKETIKARRIKHTRHLWISKDELISGILLWTPLYGRAKAGRPASNYIQPLCADKVYSLEDIPGVMDDRNGWQHDMMMLNNFKTSQSSFFAHSSMILVSLSNTCNFIYTQANGFIYYYLTLIILFNKNIHSIIPSFALRQMVLNSVCNTYNLIYQSFVCI